MNEWKFRKVDTPEKNDVLLFQVEADVPNHCGIYLGNNVFFHHAEHRLSCREPLSALWIKYLAGVYRYDA
jgi:cell wall-associated NlpC family hydrolase